MKKLAYLLETERLIPVGIHCEIVGIVFMSVGLFSQLPWLMIITMPAGMGLMGLGILAWAVYFFKNL
jgi:hypothetical protein